MTAIQDGTGTGRLTRVNGDNKLEVHATNIAETLHININDAEVYNINTETITLTSANKSTLLYIKNTSETDFIITTMVLGTGVSTGGTAGEEIIFNMTRNPTGGSIVSDAIPATISGNRNFGSNNVLDADLFQGSEGKATTGDVNHVYTFARASQRAVTLTLEILPKGASAGFDVIPPTGNTSMTVYVALNGYYREGV